MELLIVEDGFKRYQLLVEDTLLNITVQKGVHASLLLTYAGKSDDIKSNIEDYSYLKEYIDILGTETDIETIIDTVIKIIKMRRIA